MDWRANCAAVIPCLNEAPAIGSLVESVRRELPTVFVVDDGSSDQTAALAEAAGARVLRHEITRGKGAALQTGCGQARESGFGWALTLDGDGQHAPADIPCFFRCAERTGAHLVVGNRMGQAARMPPLRRLVNRWMSRQLSRAAGLALPDSQCGFRLVQLEAWAAVRLVTTHFETESELLLAFVRTGYPVEFVPVEAIYKNRQSKIHPVRDTLRWWRWWRQARRAGAA
jgi:glycosyltransferase involved in cell wall biosynthesis